MKRFKILFGFIVLPMLVCVMVSLLPSCNNEEGDNDTTTKPSQLLCIIQEIQKVSKVDISFRSSLQSIHRSSSDAINDTIVIGVNFPNGTSHNYYEQCNNASSIHDLALLAHETAADFTENIDDGTDCEVSLSQWAYDMALNDAIQESKEYLYNKGLTDDDIEEMLAENEADESSLVLFVMALSAIEIQQSMEDYNSSSSTLESFMPIMRLYANNNLVSDEYVAKILNCAMEAVGADVIIQLSKSNIKTWTKAAIKKAFGTAIKRATGAAGVVIALIVFYECMK